MPTRHTSRRVLRQLGATAASLTIFTAGFEALGQPALPGQPPAEPAPPTAEPAAASPSPPAAPAPASTDLDAKPATPASKPEHPTGTQINSPTPTPGWSRVLFVADPVTDGAVLAIGGGFAILSGMIVSTGEIKPTQIDSRFDTKQLLAIDRIAVTQTLDPNAGRLSNIALGAAFLYAVVDPILSGIRERSYSTVLVDAMIYAEALALTTGVTNLAKLAVRRPRPVAYIEFNKHRNDPGGFVNSDTNSALSFFSGHASTVATVAGTATYLAFARSPGSWRPWVTLVAGVAVSTFVDIERVRSGAHFPTDVICGSLAGGGIGVLVAHLHRSEESKTKSMWVGWQSPQEGQGGALTLSGLL